MSKKLGFLVLVFYMVMVSACTPKSHRVKVVKVKKRYVWFNHLKHDDKKRLKTVNYKGN